MFGIDNKYRRWYFELVSRPDEGGYTERHHIVPRSLGGSNEPENLVRLSYRKHFLAHWLLTKFTEGNQQHKMLSALFHMSTRRSIVSAWQYAISRRAAKEALKMRKCITNGIEFKYIHINNEIPIGWRYGRLKNTIEHNQKIRRALIGHTFSSESLKKMRGRTHSLEAREKMRKSQLGRKQTSEHIANMLAAQKLAYTPEVKAKMSESQRGRHWITDGVNNKKTYDLELSPGWRLGRIWRRHL